jgi:Fe2+ or Zn2+ uptake regulation protein
MKYDNEKLIELLDKSSLRITSHRVLIFSIIAKSRQSLTVQEILDKVRKKEIIDQATVYRNLSSLHASGLVRRLDFNHGHAHYELETGKSSYQFVCNKCGIVEKIEGISTDEFVKKMLKKSKKFKSLDSSVNVYGLCKSCVV